MAYQRCTRNVDTAQSRHSAPLCQMSLVKCLCNSLTPLIPTEHCVSDTFTFVQDIQGLSMHGKCVVSFDRESLLTNIPLEECIYLAVKYISDGNPDLKVSNPELKRPFSVATA